MWLQLIQHIVLPCAFLRMGFAIQFSWLLFLFGQLNRLWLYVCVSVCVCPVYCVPVCVQYGISISYRYTHTLPHTPPPPARRTCVFNLCALIIHNSINANKLTLSKKLYRFSYSFLRLFFSFLSPSLSSANNPVSIWVLHIYVGRERKPHQLHCRGINLSDFYVNSIHFIYSTIYQNYGLRRGTY